jgi:hypothetical protein
MADAIKVWLEGKTALTSAAGRAARVSSVNRYQCEVRMRAESYSPSADTSAQVKARDDSTGNNCSFRLAGHHGLPWQASGQESPR